MRRRSSRSRWSWLLEMKIFQEVVAFVLSSSIRLGLMFAYEKDEFSYGFEEMIHRH